MSAITHLKDTLHIYSDIRNERQKQEGYKAAGRFAHTCADPELSDMDCLAILIEEVGEAATAILHKQKIGSVTDPEQDLRKELIQVAAVAVAWIERLDRHAPVAS